MKRIQLDYRPALTISEEAFEQITAIAKANLVCEGCGQPYSPDNPNVALNLCLQCFLKKQANQRFTYIKRYTVNERGDEIHWFLDGFNAVYYTNTSTREPQQSHHYTLLYWGFPVPETYRDGEEEKAISHWHWSISGDPKADQVLLIPNTLEYGSTRFVEFLTYRQGKTIQLDRRRGEGRRLFLAARKRIEATKHGSEYHVEGQSFYSIDTYWLRKVVVAIANAEYEQQQKEK